MSKLIIVNLSTCFPFFITITTLKRCLVHLYPQLFVGGLMLCNCFVFLRLLCPMLPVSLDCPMLIVPSVFSNVYPLRLKCSGKQTLPPPPTPPRLKCSGEQTLPPPPRLKCSGKQTLPPPKELLCHNLPKG